MNPKPIPLPASVRIGPFDFTVIEWEQRAASAAGKFGECSPREETIRIDTSHSRWQTLDTLLHEINHAVWWVYGLGEEEKEEAVVGRFATAWTQIFRDNPTLFHYISLMSQPENKENLPCGE